MSVTPVTVAAWTEFRESVARLVSGVVGFTVQPGMMNGPFDRDTGCAFSTARNELENTYEEQLEVRVRLWINVNRGLGGRGQGPVVGADNTQLELWVEQVYRAMEHDEQEDPFEGVWFARPVSATIDHDTRGCEIVVVGWRDNVYRTCV